jgi:hypothetical protein
MTSVPACSPNSEVWDGVALAVSKTTIRHLDGFRRRNNGRSSLQSGRRSLARLRNAVTTDRRLRAQVQDQVIQFMTVCARISGGTRGIRLAVAHRMGSL